MTTLRSSLSHTAFLLSGSIGLLVAGLAASAWPSLALPGSSAYRVSGVLMTASDLLLLAAVILLRRHPAIGSGRLPVVGVAVSALGSAGVAVAEVLLRVDHEAGNGVFSVVGPVQALGLILLGLAVLRARVLTGWRRWALLVTGIYVPVVLGPALAVSGGENLPALAGLHALVVVSGLAVRQTRLEPRMSAETARLDPATSRSTASN